MSYILDALRKSERERVLGQVPTLSTAEVQFTDRRKRLWWWIIPVLAVVLIVGVYYVINSPAPNPESNLTTTPSPSSPRPVGPEPGVPQKLTLSDGLKGQQQIKAKAVPDVGMKVHEESEPSEGVGIPVDLAELPLEYRKQLPDLVLNVVSYSQDPKRRFVMIDLQMYREGQRVKAGPRLEQIQADGVVLSYAGRRFMLRP